MHLAAYQAAKLKKKKQAAEFVTLGDFFKFQCLFVPFYMTPVSIPEQR